MNSYIEMVHESQKRQLALLRIQTMDRPAHQEYLEELMATAGDSIAPSVEAISACAADALSKDVRWIRDIGAAGFANLYPHAYFLHRLIAAPNAG